MTREELAALDGKALGAWYHTHHPHVGDLVDHLFPEVAEIVALAKALWESGDDPKELHARFKAAPGVVRLRAWTLLSTAPLETLPFVRWLFSKARLAPLVLETFGVPMGTPGIGVTPEFIKGVDAAKQAEAERKDKELSEFFKGPWD